ncbi:MAG: hypothetical protein QOI61_2078, partial [Actinomycetota bacterium]
MTLRERFDLNKITNGAPTLPLLLLFGLNAVDELDRSIYTVLVPNIQDAFNLDIQGVSSLLGVVLIVAYLAQLPIGYLADRHSRVRMATGGAAVWGFFTLMTGLAPTLFFLGLSRSMTGIGRAVNDPTHNSLLSDY